jgi:hypothetical protein
MDTNYKEKLKSLLKDELIKGLRNVYIRHHNKDLLLFDKYRIRKTPDGYFRVHWSSDDDQNINLFNNVKTAVSYVVLHNQGLGDQAKKLAMLDAKLDTVNLEIKIHDRMSRTGKDTDTKMISLTKLQTDYLRKKQLIEDMDYYINKSKSHQRSMYEAFLKARKKDAKNTVR